MKNFKYAQSYFIGPLADGNPAIVDGPENAREYALVLSRPQPFHAIKTEKAASVEKERFNALIAVAEGMAEALQKGIDLLEPFQDSGFLGERALNLHKQALAAYEAWVKKIEGDSRLPDDPEQHRAFEDRS